MRSFFKLICCLFFLAFFQMTFAQTGNGGEEDMLGIHKVEKGETLYRISRNFFLTEKDIIEVNPGLTAENLKAGQVIKIPITVRNQHVFKEEKTETIKVSSNALYPKSTARKKTDKSRKINMAVFMPLNYEAVDQLTFTKFNIDEKKRQRYKCFDYIYFYEGIRIALNNLEKSGFKVDCYVFDVGDNDVAKVQEALNSEVMKDMDVIIPLVFKQPFSIIADYGNRLQIPIVNPMSEDLSILDNNYVFKIQPSAAAEVETIIRYIRKYYTDANIVVVHDGKAEMKSVLDYYQQLLTKGKNTWAILDYNKYASKLSSKLKEGKKNVVINLVDKGNSRDNENYAKRLLSAFSFKNDAEVILFADYSWIEFPHLDYSLLEKNHYHFTLNHFNDYSNINFVNFVKDFREHFKTEPDRIYATLGYDITMFFVNSLVTNGEEFIHNPNLNRVDNIISDFYFERKDEKFGYQNKKTTIYKMEDYKIRAVLE
ncbi:MAG: LysM peptidoglycan-binding domain-containing protein [Bacteroidales bacterium]|nr:LysM peptidoglycan-binding domain-containing protein [Bacteroidales bacterium]